MIWYLSALGIAVADLEEMNYFTNWESTNVKRGETTTNKLKTAIIRQGIFRQIISRKDLLYHVSTIIDLKTKKSYVCSIAEYT